MANGTGQRDESRPGREDRVLPFTRFLGLSVAIAVFSGFVLLFFFPDQTDRLWAWTIKPTMTPILMGAGYMAGAYYFFRVYRATQWHTVGLGLLPVSAFAWSMLIATILHWDRFNRGHVIFYLWTGLYAVTPFVVPAVWLANHRQDPGPARGETMLPPWIRVVFGVLGAAELVCVIIAFLKPALAMAIWPWKLTPFTARVVAGWFSLTGGFGIAAAADGRWSAVRVTLQAAVIGLGLILVGVARAWSGFDAASSLTWVFIAFLALLLGAFVALLLAMEARRTAPS